MDAGFHPPEPRPLQGSKISMKCSVEEILAAFTSQDVSNLEEEALYNVLKLFPTNDQMGRFGASTVDPNLSKTVVELYVKMIQMPFVDKILEVALFKVPFSHRVSQLSKDLHLLHQLSKEAKRSATLRQVLDMIPTSHFALPAHLPAPPPPPSVSNPMFQALPDLDRSNRSKVPPSPPLPPTPPPTPTPSQSNLESYSEQHSAAALQGLKEVKPKTKSPVLPPPPPPLPPPPRAHLVWRTQFVEALENCPHYTWEVQNGAPEVNRVDMKQGCCPAPPPLPSSWDLWAPKCGTYQRVARRHEVKELAVITSQLKKTEDGIHASRIEYGYAKLKAGGHKKSKIMLELCRTLSKQSADLMEFCIDSEIPCLKDAAGTDLEVQSWRYCQRELLHLRTEFDKAIVLWKTSIRKCVDTKSTRDMLDAFFSKGEQDLVDLSKFIREVESSTGNLLYHLEADKHKRRNGYLDEDEPIVSIFLKFVECFKATAADLELEKKRALQLPKVNLLDAIFSSEYLDVDHLINLVSFCPSKVQLDMFKNLVKEEGSTAKAQEKLSALLTAPKIHGKLKLLFIKKNLRAQAEKLRFRLTNLIEAAKEIMQSVELNRVVGVVALLSRTHSHGPSAPSEGEDLNDQAASNRASHNCKGGSDGKFLSTAGINLSVLYQLRSKTLLELVKYIAEKHPELLEFYKSLPHLESGTNAAEDLLAIADDIRALLRSVEDVESELKDLQSEADKCADGASDAGPSSSTMSLWRTFLLEAEADYQSVLKVWRDARRSSTELVDFFHQNRILFRVQDGLSAIQSFVKRFQQAAEAIASEEKGSEVNRLLESERTAAGLDTQEDHGLKNEETGIEAPEEEKEKPFPRIHQIFAV